MWNPFKKKNKKSKEMISTEERLFALKEDLSRYQFYQWLKGEHAGVVSEYRDVCIEHDGAVFVEFMDGRRCNVEQIGEMMLKTNNPGEILDVEPAAQTQVNNANGTKVRISDKPIESPLTALLKKQKPNPVNVDISIELNIPAPELYKVICGSFENAEDEIADYVVQSINMDSIRAIIKDGLKKYYK